MTVRFSPIGNAFQFLDSKGKPLSLGFVYSYAAGTSTPQATYTDNTGGTPNANPIALDASGRPPNEIWLTEGAAYKFIVKDSGGSTVGTFDNIPAINDQTNLILSSSLSATSGASLVGWIGSLSGAVSRTVQDKLRDVVSVKDFGAVGNGSTDDTAAIQAAINAVPSTGGTVLIPTGSYVVSSTINIAARANIRLTGVSSQGDLHGTQLIWNGAAAGTLLLLDRTRDCYFSDFSIVPGTGTLAIGIRVDNVSAPSGSTNSTNNIFERIAIYTSTTAVQIGNNSTSNNDLHTFRDVYIDGTGTNGYLIHDGQSKWIKIVGGSIAGRTNGIQTVAGSFNVECTNFSGNTTDIFLGTPTDAINIRACQSEGAQKFLDDTGLTSASFAVSIIGCRCDPASVGVDNIYLRHKKRGPVTLIGNDFAGGINYPNTRFVIQCTAPGAAAAIHGNVFPNNTPFDVSSNSAVINHAGNNYVGSGNTAFSLDQDTLTQITGNVNDYKPSQARIWRASTDASHNITGIADGWTGRELVIMNVGANAIVLQNNNAGSAAANQITTGTGADVTVAATKSARLIYDGTTLVWRLVSVSP